LGKNALKIDSRQMISLNRNTKWLFSVQSTMFYIFFMPLLLMVF
jgi:hypothetical protein